MNKTNGNESSVNVEKPDISSPGTSINWKYVIYAIIFAVVCYVSYLTLIKVQEVFGPTIDGISSVLGSAAKGLVSMTNDCIEQKDCSTIPIKDVCNTTSGCSYDPDTNKCIIVSGREAGSGGFTKCGFGVGIILYLTGTLVLGLAKLVSVLTGNNKISPQVEDYAMRSGKSNSDVLKEMFDSSRARSVEAEKTFKDKEGREMTTEEKKVTSSEVADRVLTNKTVELAEKISNTNEKEARKAEIKIEYAERVASREKAIEELKKQKKITDQEVAKIKESIKEPEPFHVK